MAGGGSRKEGCAMGRGKRLEKHKTFDFQTYPKTHVQTMWQAAITALLLLLSYLLLVLITSNPHSYLFVLRHPPGSATLPCYVPR